MKQQKELNPNIGGKEWNAVSRQSRALKKISEITKSDESPGDNLKTIIEDHSRACDEIKEKLAAHKETMQPRKH